MAYKIYVGSLVTLRLYCGITVSTSIGVIKQIHIKRPDGTIITPTAIVDTDPKYIKYTTVITDLNTPGEYVCHSSVAGSLGEATSFKVFEKYSE